MFEVVEIDGGTLLLGSDSDKGLIVDFWNKTQQIHVHNKKLSNVRKQCFKIFYNLEKACQFHLIRWRRWSLHAEILLESSKMVMIKTLFHHNNTHFLSSGLPYLTSTFPGEQLKIKKCQRVSLGWVIMSANKANLKDLRFYTKFTADTSVYNFVYFKLEPLLKDRDAHCIDIHSHTLHL